MEDVDPVDRVETPPPEDQEFEDDDGTIYKWDHKLRKFQPKAINSDAGYKLEDMTFEMEEEAIPALEMPKEVSVKIVMLLYEQTEFSLTLFLPYYHNSIFTWEQRKLYFIRHLCCVTHSVGNSQTFCNLHSLIITSCYWKPEIAC